MINEWIISSKIKMKKSIKVYSLVIFFMALFNTSYTQKSNTLFQYSIINALQQGFFSSDDFTCKALKTHGNFGLGTFNNLDGEMVLKDGIVYQILSSGEVKKAVDTLKSPLAFATYFKADTSFVIDEILSQQALYKKIMAIIQPNQTYAIKITGIFDSLKLRSVPKQQPPFILLSEVVKYQAIFNIPTSKGTMIGFLTPDFATALNVSGFHFHFLNDEATKGGHVLNSILKKATIQIAIMTAIQLQLPNSKAFNQLNLSGVDKEQLYKAEH